jgi:hypothetical protein
MSDASKKSCYLLSLASAGQLDIYVHEIVVNAQQLVSSSVLHRNYRAVTVPILAGLIPAKSRDVPDNGISGGINRLIRRTKTIIRTMKLTKCFGLIFFVFRNCETPRINFIAYIRYAKTFFRDLNFLL